MGLSRAELGEAAYVDRRILQLLELNQLGEHEAIVRVERALTALENGETLPDFKAEVDALPGLVSWWHSPVDGTRGGGCVDTGSRVGQRGTVGPLYKNRR